MSLSARIVLRPSRRVAACEGLLAIGGVAVATLAVVERWPRFAWSIGLLGVLGAIALTIAIVRRWRLRASHAITLSDRPEVGLMPLHDHVPVDPASWRVVEPTMAWPGFAVVGLNADHGARLVLPVVDRDLSDHDRRALSRFLLWTLRGGAGGRRGAASDPA